MVRNTEFLFAVRAVNFRKQNPPLEVHGCLSTAHSSPKYGNQHLVASGVLPEAVYSLK